jgi:naphthoate synthase
MAEYQDILFETADNVATVTINRPDNGNMLRPATIHELLDALRRVRDDPQIGAAILTGAGDRFFCIGGEHDEQEGFDQSVVLRVVDLYEMLDTMPTVVIAAVNGYAVGGGNVLQVVCDLCLAADTAVFRQVGPVVGSFDAGYGTWYLEDLVGRRRAKEFWYLNRKYSAAEAKEFGLVNEVVPADELMTRARAMAAELLDRGPGALSALKVAFSARNHGVLGQSRLAHDLLLTRYLDSREAHELSTAFRERRPPDRSAFNR